MADVIKKAAQKYVEYSENIQAHTNLIRSDLADLGVIWSFDDFRRATGFAKEDSQRALDVANAKLNACAVGSLNERLKREAVGGFIIGLKQIAKDKLELEEALAEEVGGEFEDMEGFGAWA